MCVTLMCKNVTFSMLSDKHFERSHHWWKKSKLPLKKGRRVYPKTKRPSPYAGPASADDIDWLFQHGKLAYPLARADATPSLRPRRDRVIYEEDGSFFQAAPRPTRGQVIYKGSEAPHKYRLRQWARQAEAPRLLYKGKGRHGGLFVKAWMSGAWRPATLTGPYDSDYILKVFNFPSVGKHKTMKFPFSGRSVRPF